MHGLQPPGIERHRLFHSSRRKTHHLRPMWSHRLHRKMNYIFREAVIRSGVFGLRRGKSGHHRVGFLAKAGGTRLKARSRLVPQKTYRLRKEARVKRWGKSPPPQGQPSGQGKPNPMQDEIGNWAARPSVPGTSHSASAGTEVSSVDE
jgi:hypothetical protein